MEQLKNYINQIHPLPKPILEEFLSFWRLKTGQKKEIITSADSIERYLYFTTNGIQKAYYSNKDGKEFIIAFTRPFTFTCVPESFLTQTPSKYTFECVTDSRFLRIPYGDFIRMVDRYHEMDTLLRKTLIGLLNGIVNRYHRMLTLTMEERFRDFMQNSAMLVNQIPHKDIANYLKIDPTNFSKLLNNIRI